MSARLAKAEAASGGWGKGNRAPDRRAPAVSGSRKEKGGGVVLGWAVEVQQAGVGCVKRFGPDECRPKMASGLVGLAGCVLGRLGS